MPDSCRSQTLPRDSAHSHDHGDKFGWRQVIKQIQQRQVLVIPPVLDRKGTPTTPGSHQLVRVP